MKRCLQGRDFTPGWCFRRFSKKPMTHDQIRSAVSNLLCWIFKPWSLQHRKRVMPWNLIVGSGPEGFNIPPSRRGRSLALWRKDTVVVSLGGDPHEIQYFIIIYYIWVVVWNMAFIFPYNHPNLTNIFRGIETTNQIYYYHLFPIEMVNPSHIFRAPNLKKVGYVSTLSYDILTNIPLNQHFEWLNSAYRSESEPWLFWSRSTVQPVTGSCPCARHLVVDIGKHLGLCCWT